MKARARFLSSDRVDEGRRSTLEDHRRQLDKLVIDGASTDRLSEVIAGIHRYIRPKTINRRRLPPTDC